MDVKMHRLCAYAGLGLLELLSFAPWEASAQTLTPQAPRVSRYAEPRLLPEFEDVPVTHFISLVTGTDGGRSQQAHVPVVRFERLPPPEQLGAGRCSWERLPPTKTLERLPPVGSPPLAEHMTRLPPVTAQLERLPAVADEPTLVPPEPFRMAGPDPLAELPLTQAPQTPSPLSAADAAPLSAGGPDASVPPEAAALWNGDQPTWVAVAERSELLVDHAFSLAEKGALYSARAEFKQALRAISQALDAHFGGRQYSEALALGWLALDEADDFALHSQRQPVVNVELIVRQHQTRILKEQDLANMSPVVATQQYFTFAQDQLVKASGGAPPASRALYGLGRLHMLLGEQSTSAERLHGPKALALHQAALRIDAQNYLAANELGVLLARFGQHQEACSVLQHSVAIRPLPESWHNLAVVRQRLGQTDAAAQAQATSEWLQSALAQVPPQPRAIVQWVPPQQFGAGEPPAAPATAQAPPSAPPPPARQAQAGRRFPWW